MLVSVHYRLLTPVHQTTRRVATRSTRANDENAVPSRSHAGTSRNAAKAVVANGSSKPSEPVKVGVKRERNVLGAVTNIRVRTAMFALEAIHVSILCVDRRHVLTGCAG